MEQRHEAANTSIDVNGIVINAFLSELKPREPMSDDIRLPEHVERVRTTLVDGADILDFRDSSGIVRRIVARDGEAHEVYPCIDGRPTPQD